MFELLKIILILLVLLFLIKKKWDLGFVLFIGSILAGLFFNLSLRIFAQNILQVLVAGETLSLIGIILLVLYLGNLLQFRGSFKTMVESLKNLIPEPRLILALPPAFIGLLPMLGGALMSAPIVEEAGRQWKLSSAWKTFLNYWFRHIWEYCWPLYPNLIVAAAILKISIKKIVSVQFPFTLLAVFIGLILLFRHIPPVSKEKRSQKYSLNIFNLFFSIWPIFLAIIIIFSLRLSMLFALASVAVLTQIFYRMNLKERARIIWKSISFKTVGLLASVMVFKRILEVSGALNSITQAFDPEGISAYIPLFIIPFFLGLLTGVNYAFVAISFPILLPVLGANHPDLVLVMFAYVSGFVGILLSPAHLCLILTVDYFRADLRDVYKILIIPASIIFMVAFLALFFLRII